MIELDGLTRRFGSVTAVDQLALSVRRGELFGLLGPDGAGKTTTLRMLAGALAPSAGRAQVAGFDLETHGDQIRATIGYVPQRFSLYGDLTISENLFLIADLFGVPRRLANERATRLLTLTGLTGAEDRRADALSGGMKQKLALAGALIHEPTLLILDEPTNGVDPVARREFWRLLVGLLSGGTTVLVATAYLDEAEQCGRIGFMAEGRLLMIGTPAELRAVVPDRLIEVIAQPRQLALATARSIAAVLDARAVGERLRVAFPASVPAERAMAALATALTEAGITVEHLRPVSPTLEDAVIYLMRQAQQRSTMPAGQSLAGLREGGR